MSDAAFCVRRKSDDKILFMKRYPGCRKAEVRLMTQAQDHPHLMRIIDVIDVFADSETEAGGKRRDQNEGKPQDGDDIVVHPLPEQSNVSPTINPCCDGEGEVPLPSPPLPRFILVVKEFGDRGTLRDVILSRRRKQHQQQQHQTESNEIPKDEIESEAECCDTATPPEPTEYESASSDTTAMDPVAEHLAENGREEIRITDHELSEEALVPTVVSPRIESTEMRRQGSCIDDVYFTEDEVLCYFCFVVQVIHHLHSHHIYHQEINTQHLFLADPITVLKLSNSSLRHVGSALSEMSDDLSKASSPVLSDTNDNEEQQQQQRQRETTGSPHLEDDDENDDEGGEAVSLPHALADHNTLVGVAVPSAGNNGGSSSASVVMVSAEVEGHAAETSATGPMDTATALPPHLSSSEGGTTTTTPTSSLSFSTSSSSLLSPPEAAATKGRQHPHAVAPTPHTRLAQSEEMWALGCLLYEMLMLEPPFDEPSLVDHLNHYMQGVYKPIPTDRYSSGVCALVAHLLQPEPIDRPQGDESLLQHPLLVPYFSYLTQREAELQSITTQLEACTAEEAAQRAAELYHSEAKAWASVMQRHIEEREVIRQMDFYRFIFVPYLERLQLEHEETKARYVWMDAGEAPGREGLEQREHTARTFILSAEAHLRFFDLTAINGEEAHHRLYYEVAEEPWRRAGVRSEAATDELVVTLSFTARHLRLRARLMREQAALALQKPPPLPHLPPLAMEAHHFSVAATAATPETEQRTDDAEPIKFVEAVVEAKDRPNRKLLGMSEIVQACVAKNAHILFRAPDMTRPILHELMHRGDVEAVRQCFATTRVLDLTTRDAFGRTPLHCIFCYGRTISMLHVLLDRLLLTHKRVDTVDWSLEDDEGHDVLSLAAYYGTLSQVWEVLKERRVRYYRKYKGRIPIRKRVRLGDWEQLCRSDRRRLHPMEGIELPVANAVSPLEQMENPIMMMSNDVQ